MSTTAISNHSIHQAAATTRLKLDQLRMSFKKQRLFIKLKSSFLTAFNYRYSIDDSVLRLYVSSTNHNDDFFEIPIYIPKQGYDAIVQEHFENHTIHLELEHSQSMLHIV